MKTLHLATAVLDELKDRTETGKQFSIYEITKAIRDKVNRKEVEVVDAEQIEVGGNMTFAIPHSEVRSLIRELIDNKHFMVANTAVFGTHDGAYTVYTPSTQMAKSTQAVAPTPAPVLAPATAPVTGIKSLPTYNTMDSGSKSLIDLKIYNHVDHKKLIGKIATLKSVQSSLKNVCHIHCGEIQDIVTRAGYIVRRQGNLKLSLSTINP